MRQGDGHALRIRHPDGLAALKAERVPGRCIVCEGPVGGSRMGRPRDVCRAVECARVQFAAWELDNRPNRRKARALPAITESATEAP